MNAWMQNALKTAAAGLVVLGLSGCNTTTHAQDKEMVKTKYMNTRTSLLLDMAERQFNSEDLEQSQRTLNDAMKINPADPRLALLSGRIALERGRLERASHYFGMAIEGNERLHGAHYFMGIVHQRWEQYEKALARYNMAYELVKDRPGYLLAKVEMLIELNRTDEALKILKDRMNYFDNNPGIRLAIAEIYVMRREYGEAVRYYKQAALLATDDMRILEELAVVQIAAGQTKKAVRHLERLTTNKELKNRDDLKRMLAIAYLSTGRPFDAKKIFTDLTRKYPGNVEDWIKLAEASWAINDLHGALRAAGRVRATAPDRHEGYLIAGMVWHKRGRVEETLRMYDTASQLAPKHAEPVILRGITLEKAGRPAAAAAAYREALKRQPADQRAQRLLAAVTKN